jgi:hypothetical protein
VSLIREQNVARGSPQNNEAEGRNISGLPQGPFTIGVAPVDLAALADVCFTETSHALSFGVLSCEFTA